MNLARLDVGIDASGGDDGFEVITAGVSMALEKDLPFGIVLFSCRDFEHPSEKLQVVKCRVSSQELKLAFEHLHSGQILSLVTATNSVEMAVHARRYLASGIKMPGLLAPFPIDAGVAYKVDVGVTAMEHDPEVFAGWALASIDHLRIYENYLKPRVGLLNNADNRACREIKAILKFLESFPGLATNFVGLIEPAHLNEGRANIGLVGGWTGNLLLKDAEELTKTMAKRYVKELEGNPEFQKKIIDLSRQFLSYDAFLVSPLVGMDSGSAFRAHGNAKPYQIARALELAYEKAIRPIIKSV